MTVERWRDGSYRICAMFYGALFYKDYYYYTKKEAIRLFKQELAEKKAEIESLRSNS